MASEKEAAVTGLMGLLGSAAYLITPVTLPMLGAYTVYYSTICTRTLIYTHQYAKKPVVVYTLYCIVPLNVYVHVTTL